MDTQKTKIKTKIIKGVMTTTNSSTIKVQKRDGRLEPLDTVEGKHFGTYDAAVARASLQYGNENITSFYSRALDEAYDFLLDEKGRCINFNPGPWHKFTQELPSWDQITGAAYIAEVEKQREVKYWMGISPYRFKVSKKEAIEIDYLDDFEIAQHVAPGTLK